MNILHVNSKLVRIFISIPIRMYAYSGVAIFLTSTETGIIATL